MSFGRIHGRSISSVKAPCQAAVATRSSAATSAKDPRRPGSRNLTSSRSALYKDTNQKEAEIELERKRGTCCTQSFWYCVLVEARAIASRTKGRPQFPPLASGIAPAPFTHHPVLVRRVFGLISGTPRILVGEATS